MKSEIDVSVIIPIYNTAPYLHRCFDSVIKSLGVLNYEVLLMDDGSEDDSPDVAKSYADTHKGFVYHGLQHGGQGNARNTGLIFAKGKYIHFMDSDDFLIPGIVEDMYNAAEYEDADFAMCNGVMLTNGKITFNSYELRCFSHIGIDEHVTNLKNNPYLVWDTTMTHKLIRRDFLNKHGIRFPGIKVFEDMLPVLKVYHYAERIATLRTRGYVYRIREDMGNTIRNVDYGYFLEKLNVMYEIFKFAKENDIPREAVLELEHKTVNGDFNYFLNNLSDFGEKADDVMIKLAELLKDCISEETISNMPLSFKQIVQDILYHDREHLQELIAYKNTDYAKAPVVKNSEGKSEIRPDEEMIRIADRCAAKDFAYSVPISYIRFLDRKDYCLTVTGHMYTNRLSLEQPDDQEITVFLQNERTGKYMEIPLERIRTEYLTKAKFSQDDEVHYNFDEAGFKLKLDFEDIASDDDFLGKNLIVMQYKNELSHGWRVLRGFSPAARKSCTDIRYLIGDRHITIWEEADGSFAVRITSAGEDAGIKAAIRSLKEERQSLLEENAILLHSNEAALQKYQELLWQNDLREKELEKTKKRLNDIREEYDVKNRIYEHAINSAENLIGRMESVAEKLEKNGNTTAVTGKVQEEKKQNAEKRYTVYYHIDDMAAPHPESTQVKYGTLTKTKTVDELGFKKENRTFAGWRVYRELDETWFLKDSNGKNSFKKPINGLIPADHTFVLYKDGEAVKYTAQSGIVHFYAQWK